MTFIYIVKKMTQQWLENMAKVHMGKNLVGQSSLSVIAAQKILLSKCSTSLNELPSQEKS